MKMELSGLLNTLEGYNILLDKKLLSMKSFLQTILYFSSLV